MFATRTKRVNQKNNLSLNSGLIQDGTVSYGFRCKNKLEKDFELWVRVRDWSSNNFFKVNKNYWSIFKKISNSADSLHFQSQLVIYIFKDRRLLTIPKSIVGMEQNIFY